jgi:tRNA threonylcarbamoyladenosine biosynthesis protein TsaE
LSAVGPWSWEVSAQAGPLERVVAAATSAGVLDLRSCTPLPGGAPVHDGEYVLPVTVRLDDLAATRALGRRLGAQLRPGDLVLLDGPLGAGKTSLTQGLGEALGVHGRVTSPTFVLAREHRGPLPLLHVDAYRLGGGSGLDDLELEAALEVGVVVVEWGRGLAEPLAASRLQVELGRAGGGSGADASGRDGPARGGRS